jgi:hypothetical protein
MIAKLAGVAVDARVVARGDDPVALAAAARWIAANTLAARGLEVIVDQGDEGEREGRRRRVDGGSVGGSAGCSYAPRVPGQLYQARLRGRVGPTGHRDLGAFADLLAALAAVPALIDPTGLPVTWRLALRALGVPVLAGPAAPVLAAGASGLAVDRGEHTQGPPASTLEVAAVRGGYRVRVAAAALLAA